MEHCLPIWVSHHLALFFMPAFHPVGFLTSLFAPCQYPRLWKMNDYLTRLQYQKVEHFPHRFREVPFVPHPRHILTPSSSAENFWTVSFKFCNLSNDKGNIYMISVSRVQSSHIAVRMPYLHHLGILVADSFTELEGVAYRVQNRNRISLLDL